MALHTDYQRLSAKAEQWHSGAPSRYLCCRLVNAIAREEVTGNPLKQMLKAIDIPAHQMNESSIDLPIVANTVLKHASKFHTSTDQEVQLSH